MKRIILFFLIVSCSSNHNNPPSISADEAIDYYHGMEIKDPYRNLENLKDTTVVNWLKEQENYASSFITKIDKRKELIEKLKNFDDLQTYNTWGEIITNDGQYFYGKKLRGEDKNSLYYRKGFNEKEILLFNPDDFSRNNEVSYQMNFFRPDWKGEKVALSLVKEGEEVSQIIVVDVKTKKVLSKEIKNCSTSLGGIRWLPDNSGFICIHLPITETTHPDYLLNTQSFYYNIENDGAAIPIDVFSKKNNPELNLKPEDIPRVIIHNDYEDYAFGEIGGSSLFYDMYYTPIENLLKPNTKWSLLYTQNDKVKKMRLDKEGNIVFLSAKNASNYKLCRTNFENPDFENPEVIIPESDIVIDDFVITKDGIYFTRIKNGVHAKLYHIAGSTEKEIKLPKTSGKITIRTQGRKNSDLRIYSGGWISDNEVYNYNFKEDTFTDVGLDPKVENTELENLVVEEIEIESHDGVKVPLSLIYPKGTNKDKNNYTLFYGYGSYGGGVKPFYSTGLLTWALEGGIIAVAHVRGGGEKGEKWHKAGFKTTKANTWKDMIACTEYMIREGYTVPEKSAIWGDSAGGIMAGRAMTERPDLYKAVLLTSPALNMVRCEIQPNGPDSVKEFGTVKIKDEFEALLEMDSYHHIKEGEKYPATLVTGGMKDGRVVIWDPAKFVARLQAENGSENPILFSVDFDLGHSAMNASQMKFYDFFAKPISFAYWQLGHPDYQIQ
ncbi:prolyl oligopeptidase family serine peptidase [Aquimarina sp. D1M17]|uniref:prolyl oligopeptidase family serine peptidase n=1 Tax=Aquimarina acroporae TaxID=2937283 RepID=UPI0020C13AE6|nr:prolyl oligopeptidase family serine peptidase [Aquimarina acroporae]MCK8521486.1 prolyl oligopeptidase family serine peptidase [Aquimarina acroporae]